MNTFTDSIFKKSGKVFKVVIASQRVGAKRRSVGSHDGGPKRNFAISPRISREFCRKRSALGS